MKFLMSICSLFLAVGFASAQDSFTIQEAISYALKNNVSVKLDAIAVAQAEQDVKEYYALGLPRINGSVDFQHFLEIPVSFVPAEFFGGQPGTFAELQFGLANSLVAGASLSQLIFDGSFFTGLKAQKLYRELASKSINQTEFDIKKAVTEAYVNVLTQKENLKLIDKNLENIQKAIVETKAFYESGFIEKLDVDRLELSYDNLASQRKNLENFIVLAKNLLKFQMNYPLEKQVDLTQTLDDIVDVVLVADVKIDGSNNYNLRPEYETILLGQKLNELNLEATRNSRYPSLVGFANYQQQLQRNNLFDSDEPGFTPISVVGVSLNVPIYNGGSVRVNEQKIKLDIEKTELQKQQFERGVDIQVATAYQQYLIAKDNVYSAKRRQALADEIYDVTLIKYKEGVGSSVETSQAERDVYVAQQQYMQALTELVNSKLALDSASGEISTIKY